MPDLVSKIWKFLTQVTLVQMLQISSLMRFPTDTEKLVPFTDLPCGRCNSCMKKIQGIYRIAGKWQHSDIKSWLYKSADFK